MRPFELTATEASALIARGKLSCEELARSCLDRIAERDPSIKAWTHIDRDQSLRQARELDKSGPKFALHGVPVGFKDIIATQDMPTEHNSALYQGHQPGEDAHCVGVVRHSGGLVLGKTETVEFASGPRKAATRNPRDARHTPGGSSSGSAAAVADRHVPLAIGTQTGGSVIRPAAFCGVFGFKPTHGLVSYAGARPIAPTLDTIGWFARDVDDLILLARAFRLPSHDAAEPKSAPGQFRIGICRGPLWSRVNDAGQAAFESAAQQVAAAGFDARTVTLPSDFDRVTDAANQIINWERQAVFLADRLRFGPAFPEWVSEKIDASASAKAEVVFGAYDLVARLRGVFDAFCASEGYAALITPAAPGEAPEGLQSTGDAVMNTMWTGLHAPAIAIPVGVGHRNLPLAIQLVGPRGSDMRLLAVASNLARRLVEPTSNSLSRASTRIE